MRFVEKGNKPRLLIHTGTHGDEYGVIKMVEECLKKYESKLPDYIFVPEVSPSAVEMKTRKNKYGHDMNREFLSNSDDPEVQENIKIIKNERFDLFVSFHEDWEFPEYYIYDWGYTNKPSELVTKHNEYLKENGIRLLNGVDDPTDPHLGYKFSEGYNKSIHVKKEQDDGIISDWVLNRNIATDYLLPEIPQRLSDKKKKFIVDSFFTEVILKYFTE